MRFLLTNFFQSSWFLVIVLVLSIGLLLFTSFSRRRKEEQYRTELDNSIVKGAKVRTVAGLYGTVVSIRNTTDGKIVLIETGEGNKKSYQQLHINAICGLDESEEVVIDSEGNEVPISELNKPKEEVKEEQTAIEEVKEEQADIEEVKEKTAEVEETEEK